MASSWLLLRPVSTRRGLHSLLFGTQGVVGYLGDNTPSYSLGGSTRYFSSKNKQTKHAKKKSRPTRTQRKAADGQRAGNDDPPALKTRSMVERSDSLDANILQDRAAFQKQLDAADPPPPLMVERMQSMDLGRKRHSKDAMNPGLNGCLGYIKIVPRHEISERSYVPEFAFIGHSNAGKSTLLNFLSGHARSHQLADVSNRAGWTTSLTMYELGRLPPQMRIVDTPGYGLVVAKDAHIIQWARDLKKYLRSDRGDRMLVYVLVECLRGVCKTDRDYMGIMDRAGVPYQVLLTKADLLPPVQLAKAVEIVLDEMETRKMARKEVTLVSSATGAGASVLWDEMSAVADRARPGLLQERIDDAHARRDASLALEPQVLRRRGGAAGVAPRAAAAAASTAAEASNNNPRQGGGE